jgi:aminopeptidase N
MRNFSAFLRAAVSPVRAASVSPALANPALISRALINPALICVSLTFVSLLSAPCRAQAAQNQQGSSGQAPAAQQPAAPQTFGKPPSPRPPSPNDKGAPVPTRYEMLRGAYGPFRANNDLLYYHLDIRVDPEKKFISGKNTIRFRMLKDGNRIQIDLTDKLDIDKILLASKSGSVPLQYTRDTGAVFIDFPETLHAGEIYSIDFYYSGHPPEMGRFGAFTFKQDPAGRVWINTACEGTGASIWWPDKDQWRDEVESMDISVAVPNGLVDVSNGRFVSKTDLGDGYTRWDWHVSYPINNYDVSLNIGDYVHFSDSLGPLSLDYYVLPEDLAKARTQFAQARGMLEAYQHYFGPYPFTRDGYKLIEAPYSGMEHQSAVTYGNRFENGYLGRDWTATGISLRFDFIIIHESAHEWFGNSITAADPADMWIHEGWATYLESLYVEYRWGKADAITYLNGFKPKVYNLRPIVAERGVNADPTEDQYFKGALMLNTLRSVVDDDARWFALLHDFYQHFKYQNILTEDVIEYFNRQTGMNLTPIFNQYLRHVNIPRLELLFGEAPGMVMYKWDADEDDFAMPVRVGSPDHWQIIHPTTQWQWMQSPLAKDDFQVATDLYYVDVNKQ